MLLVVLMAVIIRQTQQALTLQVHVQQARTPAQETTLYNKAFLEMITFGIYAGGSTAVAVSEDHIAAWTQAQRVIRRSTGASA